jgi:hypothetical protein
MYVVDSDNNKIRKKVIASGAVSTVAGSGSGAFVDGNGILASFNSHQVMFATKCRFHQF